MANTIGCKISPPPVVNSIMSNGGNNESKKAKKEKIKPIGVPINIAVQEPILSSFFVVMFSCFNYSVFYWHSL